MLKYKKLYFGVKSGPVTKEGDKGKQERVSKQKLLKGCHQGQNFIVLTILERLEFETISCRPTMVADNTF